jgi:hypothetical protein
MFQKSFLGNIEIDSITQSLRSGLEKNLVGLKDGMYVHIIIGNLHGKPKEIFYKVK